LVLVRRRVRAARPRPARGDRAAARRPPRGPRRRGRRGPSARAGRPDRRRLRRPHAVRVRLARGRRRRGAPRRHRRGARPRAVPRRRRRRPRRPAHRRGRPRGRALPRRAGRPRAALTARPGASPHPMASTRTRLRGTRGRAPLRAPHRRPAGRRPHDRSWWQDGILYQVYPRSFADADGDGHGDLRGLRARLGHLARLGASGLWLNPTCPSADADWGYDVTGYCDVHPDFGTLEDMDALLADAHAAGIRVLLDLVPNHTSDRHPWFQESRASRDNPKADWYVWADPRPDGAPPNNWVSMFGGPAWEFEPRRGQYYLRNFTRNQPDLNWWCEDVRDEFDRVLLLARPRRR